MSGLGDHQQGGCVDTAVIPPVDDIAECLAQPHEPASVALTDAEVGVRQATSGEPRAQAFGVDEVVMPFFEVRGVEEVLQGGERGRCGRPATGLRVRSAVTTHHI
jgi:hypothetical protein